MTEVKVHRPLPSRSPVQYTEMRPAKISLAASGLPLESNSFPYYGHNSSSPVPPSPTSSSASSSNSSSRDQPQQQPTASARQYHELRSVPNEWEMPSLPAYNHHHHHHHQQPSAVVPPPWTAPFASTPDLRRSHGLGLSGTDLSFYGSTSDRFSGYLTMSSDSLGAFKLDGSRDILSDYESLKGSHDTLESGYRSMLLNSLINDQKQHGSLKELSYSEVADTLLSIRISTDRLHPGGPTAGVTPATASEYASTRGAVEPGSAERAGKDSRPPGGGGVPVIGGPEVSSEVPHHQYYPGYETYSFSSKQPPVSPAVPSAAYGSSCYPHYYSDSAIMTGRWVSSLDDAFLSSHRSNSSLGLADSCEASRPSDAPFWTLTQSTTNIPSVCEASYTNANTGSQLLHSLSASEQFSSRDSVIKSSKRYELHASAPPALLLSQPGDAGSAASHRDRFIHSRHDRARRASPVGDSSDQVHRCHFCNKMFSRPSTLKTHIKTHIGEKPYLCQVCGKTFFQAANLTAHFRVHSGEKPFSCVVCGKHFSQSSSVKTHMRTHSGERPYSCLTCSKSFSDNSTLTKHQRIHSGMKPYRCSVCKQSFSQSGNLSRHMKVHRRPSAPAATPPPATPPPVSA